MGLSILLNLCGYMNESDKTTIEKRMHLHPNVILIKPENLGYILPILNMLQ